MQINDVFLGILLAKEFPDIDIHNGLTFELVESEHGGWVRMYDKPSMHDRGNTLTHREIKLTEFRLPTPHSGEAKSLLMGYDKETNRVLIEKYFGN